MSLAAKRPSETTRFLFRPEAVQTRVLGLREETQTKRVGLETVAMSVLEQAQQEVTVWAAALG